MKVNITYEIPSQRVADLVITAVEGGCNYWCNGLFLKKHNAKLTDGNWYADPKLYDESFILECLETVDERTGETKSHLIGPGEFSRGFDVMARDFPKAFEDFMSENDDAETADIFMQCVVFGELIYG